MSSSSPPPRRALRSSSPRLLLIIIREAQEIERLTFSIAALPRVQLSTRPELDESPKVAKGLLIGGLPLSEPENQAYFNAYERTRGAAPLRGLPQQPAHGVVLQLDEFRVP